MDLLSTIIGGAIGFLSSIGTVIVTHLINKKGKLNIYYKFISSPNIHQPWGVYNGELNTIYLDIPVVFEFQNTSNSTRVIRDVSLEIFSGNRFVAKLHQCEFIRSEKKKDGVIFETTTTDFGTENNSYSFVLPPRSIQKQKCDYLLKIDKNETDKYSFDSIVISYYNERNKKKSFTVKNNLSGWDLGAQKTDDDWQKAK